MIDYVEIRNGSREVVGIIDTALSVIWHRVYYGVGDFEIYAQATPEHLALLKIGSYVTRPDDTEVGIIEALEITNSPQSGLVIVAAGRFAKSILDRRLIYRLSRNTNTATNISGVVETAVRKIVNQNAINCPFDLSRNINELKLGPLAGITKKIVDDDTTDSAKQTPVENLLDFTDSVLREYEMSAVVTLDSNDKKLAYTVWEGVDRSVTNTAGREPVIFSPEYDNLLESTYTADSTTEKTTALIGGEGEGLDRFYALLARNAGLSRREVFIDGSSVPKKYKDESDVEITLTDAQYNSVLRSLGRQNLALLNFTETFTGKVDVTNGRWKFAEDFFLGDLVTLQDNQIGKYVSVRITEVTEVQDENGFSVNIDYE